MIGVLAQGQLGNQMFQLAFAASAAKQLNTSFFIAKSNSLHYFKLGGNFDLKNRINSFLGNSISKNVIDWPNRFEGSDYLLRDIKNNTFYKGYFQSEEYFKKYDKWIKDLFEIKEKYKKGLNVFLKRIENRKYIAVHIRRGDYLKHGDESLGGADISLPMTYYKNCFEKINNLTDYKVVFVSDDPEFVKREFGSKDNYCYERNDEITDFQILQNAEILVTANSTFSWWAAWLNKVPGKRVFAPEYFLGFKVKKYYPAGIKTPGWEWISVN